MKFHVGQRVRVIRAGNGRNIGEVGTVVEGPFIPEGCESIHYRVALDNGYRSDYGDHPNYWPESLQPIDDDFRAGSWDEICALTRGWRPGVVTCG